MVASASFRFEKRIASCKNGSIETLEGGEQIKYQVVLVNTGQVPLSGVVCDVIPAWFGSASWNDTDNNSGTSNDIANSVTVQPNATYVLNIEVVVAAPDPCKAKTFTNYSEFKQDGCEPVVRAKADTCILGCADLRFDPRVQRMDDRRALSLLFDWDEVDWCRFIDAINCDTVYIPGTPDDPGPNKQVIIDCLNALGKEGLGKIIQGQQLTVADFQP